MSKKEFNSEKNKLQQRIAYHIKNNNDDRVEALLLELAMLYVKQEERPQKRARVYETWKELRSTVRTPEEIAEEDLLESVRSRLSTVELRSVRRLMNNYNIQFDQKCKILTERHGLSEEDLVQLFEEMGIVTGPTQFEQARFNELKRSKRYLISSAQSGSPINEVFFENMKEYAEFIDAEIGIIATRYRNPTSRFNEESDVWDSRLDGYLTAVRQQLHKNLVLVADLKIQATSPNPTNGLDSFEGNKSIIVGAPTVDMRSIPVLPSEEQKFIRSTGSVTVPDFTDSMAGGRAEDIHSYGFVVVEIENDDVVHMRNVVADVDGSFNDLIFRVKNGEIYDEEVETLVWGDSHFAQKDERVTNAFRGLCKDLGIKKSVLHDVWDSKNLNVHNNNNPIEKYRIVTNENESLEKEFDQLLEELQWFEDNMEETIIVRSNHDDMLDRAMITADWKDNLKNAKMFIKLLYITLQGKAPEGLIPYIVNSEFEKVRALGIEESFVRHGVELALHGHKGPNGSRGNPRSFGRLTTPNIIGHSHSPCIKWGTVQVGVSCSLQHGYNQGLSSWAYAGATLNKHGARQLIVFNKNTLTYTTLY